MFSTATGTIADLADQRIYSPLEPKLHQLDDKAEDVSLREVDKMPALSSSTNTTPIPVPRDPSLTEIHDPLSYTAVFVDDFVDLAQTTLIVRRVSKLLLHAIDDVF